MAFTRETMLARMLASDGGWNGQFITGVVSTGIYCLPSCRARKPKPENVVFYDSPQSARAAGLRPCKRCRPDDFYLGRHAGEALVEALVAGVTLDPGAYRDVGSLVAAAGVSASKLHELFRTHYHTTPAELLARSRVTAARRALLSGERPITEIAFEVGFESLSTFGDNFRKYSAMTPQAYRRLREPSAFDLALPDGYPLQAVLHYLDRDRQSLTERVLGSGYTTVLRLRDASVLARVSFAARTARCTITPASALDPQALLQGHERLLKILGLHVDPLRFEAQVSGEVDLASLVQGQRGLRVPLLADLFDGLVWAIVGQHNTFAFACTLRRRLVQRWGEPFAGGLYAPLTPYTVALLEVSDLLPLGFSRSKAEYLIGAARSVVDGRLPLRALQGKSV